MTEPKIRRVGEMLNPKDSWIENLLDKNKQIILDPDELVEPHLIAINDGIIDFLREKSELDNEQLLELVNKYAIKKVRRSRSNRYYLKKYTTAGLNTLLRWMEKQGMITIDRRKMNHHVYRLGESEHHRMASKARVFAREAGKRVFATSLVESSKTSEENVLNEIVRKWGVFALFIELHGRQILKKYPPELRDEMYQTWIKAAYPNIPFSDSFEDSLQTLLGLKGFDRFGLQKYDRTFMILSSLYEKLKTSYPELVTTMESAWNDSNILLKQSQEYEADETKKKKFKEYQRRLDKKMNGRNNQKKVKQNQCPRCGFDGSKVILTGPRIGQRDKRGFTVLFPGEDPVIRFCPQCQYVLKTAAKKQS